MGESWMFLWVCFAAGVVTLGCAVWFWVDNRKHSRPVKAWHYILSVLIALVLMLPVGWSLLFHLVRYGI